MPDTQSKNQEVSYSILPLSPLQAYSSTYHAKTSTRSPNPLAVSFTEDGKSLDGYTSFKAEGYECIDGDYERAEEDVAEKLDLARSNLYWKNVWNHAVWRSKPKLHNAGANKAGKPTSITTQARGRVIAAGVNIEVANKAKNPRSRTGKVTGTKESKAEHSSDRSPGSSNSSSSLCSVENEDLQLIHKIELDEYWNFLEPPDIEDDWDMIPETDRLREITMRPTFNTLIRERMEALKVGRGGLGHEK